MWAQFGTGHKIHFLEDDFKCRHCSMWRRERARTTAACMAQDENIILTTVVYEGPGHSTLLAHIGKGEILSLYRERWYTVHSDKYGE